jgi:acetate kinase
VYHLEAKVQEKGAISLRLIKALKWAHASTPMSILVLNAGSSSLRFTLFAEDLKELYSGHVDAIGQKHCQFRHYLKKGEIDLPVKIKNHKKAIIFVLKKLKEEGAVKDFKDIKKVAHRIVHGGEKYKKPTLLNKEVLKELDQISSLAPLHNPVNLLTARACQKTLPQAAHYAIFDTGFHSTLPQKAFLYGLPYELYQKEQIRRYGFHGTSHKYVSQEAVRFLKKKAAKLITCHMGNGISLAAIKDGKVLDTTMGLTPLEGPIMGTRSGTLDPGIIFHLLEKTSTKKLRQLLEHESGFKGLSQIGSDVRDLWAKPKSPGTKRTFDVLCYQMAKLMMSLTVALEGTPDAIVFTAGIGEHAFYLREKILSELPLPVELNPTANRKNSLLISKPKSKIKVLVLPTNEQLQMARDLP